MTSQPLYNVESVSCRCVSLGSRFLRHDVYYFYAWSIIAEQQKKTRRATGKSHTASLEICEKENKMLSQFRHHIDFSLVPLSFLALVRKSVWNVLKIVTISASCLCFKCMLTMILESHNLCFWYSIFMMDVVRKHAIQRLVRRNTSVTRYSIYGASEKKTRNVSGTLIDCQHSGWKKTQNNIKQQQEM